MQLNFGTGVVYIFANQANGFATQKHYYPCPIFAGRARSSARVRLFNFSFNYSRLCCDEISKAFVTEISFYRSLIFPG